MRRLATALALACTLPACDKTKAEADPAPKTTTSSTIATSTMPSGSQSATTQSAPTEINLPPGRSKVPTLEEWNAVGEVTVKGSSALSCETKMVREWFRASCRGNNDSGGRPTTVEVTKGGGAGTYAYTVAGVTSLVTAFVEGTQLEAVFSWTDKSHKLVLSWPKGAPKPPILGVFEGAKSPLDRAVSGDSRYRAVVCKCERENPLWGGGPIDVDCDQVDVNEDCARSYSDCLLYQKCAIGEPSVMPTCLPGYAYVWVNKCAKKCASDADCSGEALCIPSPVNDAQRVCVD